MNALLQCRVTMARIKQILNERRIAYEQAHALAFERQKSENAQQSIAEQSTHAEEIEERSARQERIEAGLVGSEHLTTTATIPEQARVPS